MKGDSKERGGGVGEREEEHTNRQAKLLEHMWAIIG